MKPIHDDDCTCRAARAGSSPRTREGTDVTRASADDVIVMHRRPGDVRVAETRNRAVALVRRERKADEVRPLAEPEETRRPRRPRRAEQSGRRRSSRMRNRSLRLSVVHDRRAPMRRNGDGNCSVDGDSLARRRRSRLRRCARDDVDEPEHSFLSRIRARRSGSRRVLRARSRPARRRAERAQRRSSHGSADAAASPAQCPRRSP